MKQFQHPFRTKIHAISGAAAICLAAAFAPSVSGQTTYTWSVAGGNWSSPASWTPSTTGPSGPLAEDYVVFGNTGVSSASNTINNIVDSGFAGTVADLTYNSVSQSPYIFDYTEIPSGTLTVTNRLLVGGLNEPGNTTSPWITYAFMVGPGTFEFTGTNFAVENYSSSSSTYLTTAYMNLSGLTNFVLNSPNGILGIADTTLPQTSGSQNVRAGGNLLLAAVSNSISVSTINLGTCTAPQGGSTDTLGLGTGTNIINVGTFNVANNKNPANVVFNGPTGGLTIRGPAGGTSAASIIVGNRNVGSGTGTTPGQMLLNGHPVNILASTLVVGEVSVTSGPSSSSNGGQFGNGTFQFDTGIVDASNVVMAFNEAPNAGGGLCGSTSVLTVGANGTLLVGAGGLSLINQTASNVCSSTLTISNGTVACNGNITAVTNAAAGTGASAETNVIKFISGGTLTLGAGCYAGVTNSPIGQLVLDTNSILQFVSPPPNNQPAIAVNTLVWPANDSALTFVISNLPATATAGTTIPLVQFGSMTGGSFNTPVLVLPSGVTGTLSISGNQLVATITSTVYPTLTPISLSLITLCTNSALTVTASSTASTIANVQVVATTTTLGGFTTPTVTNSLGSPLLTVTGLGTSTAVISYALATNTIYSSVTVQVTDAAGKTVSISSGNFDTLVPSLVIEASDFNFSGGSFIDTPANGGLALYQGKVGTQGIDENKNPARTNTESYYRPADAVVMQNANPGLGTPPSATEQKFVTAAANGDTVDVEQEVGYNSPGDWLNYTRTFGSGGSAPAGTYNVWAYLATSGSGAQASFWQVTNPTQTSQTTNFLGNFGSASFTDNGYDNYVYVPLLDQYGNRATVTVANGQQTFKSVVSGNPNLGFYLFVPVAPIYTPTLLQVAPNGSVPFQQTNEFTFTISPEQGESIAQSGIQLILNGVNVTSGANFSEVGGIWTVSIAIASNELYSAVINVTNSGGLSLSYSNSFDTFSQNNFQWEAVDYDFSTNNGTGAGGTASNGWSGGLFIQNSQPSGDTNEFPNNGTIQSDSYWSWPTAWTIASDGYGAIAQQGIDINWPTNSTQGNPFTGSTQANASYRNADGVGSMVASDYLRYKFLVAQTNFNDPAICQYNIGYFYASNWLNYTRIFPTNSFNIWGRIAGGGGAFSGATLSLVTSGVGTSNQTTQVLGTFSDANPAGWQVYHTIPLLDTNGNMVTVQLSGQETLRLTAPTNASPGSGALNPLYFMLTPATVPSLFHVAVAESQSQVQLSFPTQWGHNYAVWYSESLQNANWTQIGTNMPGDGLSQVVDVPITSSQGYYRVSAH